MNEFKDMSSPPLPFPLQHALTQTVAAPASAQEKPELMTLWAGQSAALSRCTNAPTTSLFPEALRQKCSTAFKPSHGERQAPPPPIAQLIGFHLISVKSGEAVIEFQATEAHANPTFLFASLMA